MCSIGRNVNSESTTRARRRLRPARRGPSSTTRRWAPSQGRGAYGREAWFQQRALRGPLWIPFFQIWASYRSVRSNSPSWSNYVFVATSLAPGICCKPSRRTWALGVVLGCVLLKHAYTMGMDLGAPGLPCGSWDPIRPSSVLKRDLRSSPGLPKCPKSCKEQARHPVLWDRGHCFVHV